MNLADTDFFKAARSLCRALRSLDLALVAEDLERALFSQTTHRRRAVRESLRYASDSCMIDPVLFSGMGAYAARVSQAARLLDDAVRDADVDLRTCPPSTGKRANIAAELLQ